MVNENTSISTIIKVVVLIPAIALLILILYIIFNLIPFSSIPTLGVNTDFLYIGPQTYPSSVQSISSVREYNTTWLEFDGANDVATLTVTQSKATVSLWFQNETTGWTSLIKAGADTYIDGALDNTWNFFPYFISGDVITIGKSDGSTFLDVDIDEFRVYESALNSSDVTIVFEEGR